jgi:anti-sigma B factor antagonist
MEIKTTHLKRCDLIELSGRLDSSVAPELQHAFRESIDNGVFRIIVDMSKVEFFGSAAIRALVMAYKECRRWNRGDVRLAGIPAKIRGVFDIAGITPMVNIYDNATEAVGSF